MSNIDNSELIINELNWYEIKFIPRKKKKKTRQALLF